MVETAERIRQGMELREMNQARLSELAQINKGALSSYLAGRYEPKQTTIYKIAKALNVNEAWLMGYDVPYQRTNHTEFISAEYEILDITAKNYEDKCELFQLLKYYVSIHFGDRKVSDFIDTDYCCTIYDLFFVKTDSIDLSLRILNEIVELFAIRQDRTGFSCLFNYKICENSILTKNEFASQMLVQKTMSIFSRLNSEGKDRVFEYANDIASLKHYASPKN